jgi:anaerobic selenocysteine-containing dehydrogenase
MNLSRIGMSSVSCKGCGRPFISEEKFKHVLRSLDEKNMDPGMAGFFSLCQECRRGTFARNLLGDSLQRVARVPWVSKRISEEIQPLKTDSRTGATIYKSECFICNAGCDARVWVKDGRVIKVEGDPSSPVTKGTLCAKGLASTELLYHPERLTHPMKRVGERGENRWQRISWDQALDIIAARFKETEQKYGNEAIACVTGTSRGWVATFSRFANAWGKQWTGPGVAQCYAPRAMAQTLTLGGLAIECPDYSATQCMLIWGANPAATWHWKALGMMEAWARGAKMVVVDPVLSETASKADIWLRIRPGTDAALALAMLHVIIDEELFDKEFVGKWCVGFNELKERVREYAPGKVEKITWIAKEQIVEVARLYAALKPACITQVVAIEQNADTISTCRAIAMLAAISGNIDIPGGNLFPMPVPTRSAFELEHGLSHLLTQDRHDKRLGSREYPLLSDRYNFFPSAHNATLWKAILTSKPYPVRALYNHGSDMLLAFANGHVVRKAILSLDFFVVADLFLTSTAELADIVLPAASWLERSMPQANLQVSYNNVHLQQKVAELGECRSDVRILNEVAKRLGFGQLMFDSEEHYYDFVLKPSGMTWQQFKEKGIITVPFEYRKYERNGFRTPSGKIELYSQGLKDLGFDPLPDYKEPSESPVSNPELASEYPLILTTGSREPVFRHSELRQVPVLRQIWPEPKVKIHPDTAQKLNIREGDRVRVETLRGTMEAKAWLREDIDPRVIQVPSHWPGKGNVNLITDNERCAPAIGSAQLRCQLCRVSRGE